jgi:hypothetical protein
VNRTTAASPSTSHLVNDDDSDKENHPKQGGRPKGTTVMYLRDKQLKYKALVDSVATEWNQVKQLYKYKCIPKNMLDGLIKKKVQESGLNVAISKNAIRKRVQKSRLTINNPGAPSPMADIEVYIASLINQMSKMHQPLNVSEGLQLANSLVQGTEWKENIIELKKMRGWKQFTSDRKQKPLLGQKWYKCFWKCKGTFFRKKQEKSFQRTEPNGQCTAISSKSTMKYMHL